MQTHENPDPPRAERIAALNVPYGEHPLHRQACCNLCGDTCWTVLTHHDRYGFPAQTAACSTCGLACLNPRMDHDGYGHFYREVYRPLVSAYHGRRIDAVTIQDEQRAYAAETALVVGEFLEERRGRDFLDVGGSTGIVSVDFAKRFGLRPTVLDPAPDEIQEAEALGIETLETLVEDWDPGERRFDIVGMFQTIDHLLDVAGTLAKLRSAIAEDGVFLVDIVDFRAAYLKHWNIEAATKIDHPFSLTEDTAEAYLRRAGFRIVKKAYSADYHLVMLACRPCEPEPGYLPSSTSVEAFFRELRFVQNAPRPGGPPS